MRISRTNSPFEVLYARFRLAAEGESTRVAVSPRYQLKYGVLGVLLDWLFVRLRYRRGIRLLLAGLKKYVESSVLGSIQ